MALRILSLGFLSTFFSCSLDRQLPDDITTTACFKTHSSIKPTSKTLPQVQIAIGDAMVFDYVRIKGDDKKIINGDTVITADTDFFERVTFAVESTSDSFNYSGKRLISVNGCYEFHGGEAPLANTDFKIKNGFVKGKKQNGNWFVEVSISVVDKQKADSNIQKITFSDTFKSCN